MKIQNLPLDPKLISVLTAQGYTSLYPPQRDAIKQGVLDGKNLVLAIPTASGKTLIAILAMLKAILEHRGRALYLVPLRALASEKYREFKQYESLGIRVAYSTGDYDAIDRRLRDNDIIITTNEKADSLLRHRSDWMSELAVIVSDEVHLINDAHRGPTLEIVLAKLKEVNPHAQFLALSATIRNADEIAEWLNANLITSDWRPTKLNEGVYSQGTVIYKDEHEETLQPLASDDALNMALHAVKRQKQALVFVNTRRSTEAFAKKASGSLASLLTRTETRALETLSNRVLATGERTRFSKSLAAVLANGAAFHHAGLNPKHREIIELAFRQNQIKILSATTTLAAGIDLPAETVVVRDYRRYEGGLGYYPIPVLEYRQMRGRAGRPRFDKVGNALLIAKSPDEQEFLLKKYILGPTEQIWSKLASEPAMRMHLLATIATGYASNEQGIMDFIDKTFYGQQYDPEDIEYVLQRVLGFLKEEDLIRPKGKQLVPSPLGLRTAQLYIDPKTAVVIRDAILHLASEKVDPTPIGLLQMVAHTPDLETVYLRKGDYEKLSDYADMHTDDFILPPPDQYLHPTQYEFFLSELKTGSILYSWANETPEDQIIGEYQIGSGDILRLVSTAEWLLYATSELAKLQKISRVQKIAGQLRIRVKAGCKAELLPLIQLPGIGRVRGRILYDAGYTSPKKIGQASVEALVRLPLIGGETVSRVKEFLGEKVDDLSGLRLKPEEDSETYQPIQQDTLTDYEKLD